MPASRVAFNSLRAFLCVALTTSLAGAATAALEVHIRSSKDGTLQPAMFHVPAHAGSTGSEASVPLVVSLHSWSTGHAKYDAYESTLLGCQKRGWIFLSPHFRGGNNRPEACGSDLAVQDVLDAVAYAQANARVDPKRIFAVGSAHMPLVLAHRAPRVWAGISAWLPITDLVAFHRFNHPSRARYSDMVELCCGGPPGRSETDAQYKQRSPIHFLREAVGVPIDINVGLFDGHRGDIVPIDQSLRAFNVLAQANGHPRAMLSEPEIIEMTRGARVPADLAWNGPADPERRYSVLFRRSVGPVRLTIYEGGHVWDEGHRGDAEPALRWIAERHFAGKQ